MEILKNKNLHNFGVYVIGNILNGAIPFLLLPVLTENLSKTDMGIIGNLELLIGICLPISALNSSSALTRYYFELDPAQHRRMMFNHLALLFSITLVLIILLLILDPFIKEKLMLPDHTVWVVALIAMSKQMVESLLNMFRVTENPTGFGVIRILSTAFDFGISILLILMVVKSWEGRFYGQLIAYAIFACISVIILIKRNWLSRGFDRTSIKKMVSFGLPLIPHTIGGMLLAFGDRLIITNELGIAAVGVYFVGYQAGMVMSLIQTSFNQAWSPWFYKKLSAPTVRIKKQIVRLTYGYALVLAVVAFLLYLIMPLLFDWFINPKYHIAQEFVVWILIGYGLNGMYKMMVNYLLFEKKTVYVAVITLTTAAINIGLNFWLIPRNGLTGAAQATTISFFIQMIGTALVAAKLYKMPWFNFRDD